MNKFRILIPLLVTPAIVAPICLSTTSCLAGSTITPKTIDFDNFSKETKYSDLKSCGKNFWNLMYGKTNNYNHGDYVIFMGLSTDASLSNVLFSDKDSEQYDSKSLKSYDLLNALPSINTIISQDKDNPVQSLKILSYVGRVIYNMPETNYDVNSKKFVPTYEATPFSKWTDAMYKAHDIDYANDSKKLNKWHKQHKTSDYIRNDSDAKQYRKLTEIMTKVFGTASLNADKTFGAIAWYNGKPTPNASSVTDSNSAASWLKGIYI